MTEKTTLLLSFVLKITTYLIIFGGLKILEVDQFIVALTDLMNAVAKSI